MSGLGALASGFGFGQSTPDVDYKGAKRGIRWRVKDAKKAGIHPLYAIGAPGVGQGILKSGGANDPGAGFQGAGAALGKYAQTQLLTERHNADVAKTKAETDYINEQIKDAQAARDAQGQNQSGSGQEQMDVIHSPLGSNRPGPHTSAQDMEDQYGGVVGEFHGISRYAHDRAYRAIAGDRHPPTYENKRYHSDPYRGRKVKPRGRNRARRRWR